MASENIKTGDLSDGAIELALIKGRGVIKKAAQLLGCGRSSLSRRIQKSEHLANIRKTATETFLDEVEDLYFEKMMKTGDKVMMIFYLKCHGKDRGWVERQEITGKDGEALGEVVAPVRQMDAADWAKENLKVIG